MPAPSNGMASHRTTRSRSKKLDDIQLDLFIALPSDLPARDQQDLMERPFFSLSKNKRTTPIEYKVGENYVRVTANTEHGMATIWGFIQNNGHATNGHRRSALCAEW